ncbi:MAG TPA: hypothetical protein VLT84_11230 [Acidobacteriota bacterium]|nr:hypothetical protein [Acidobacteriota bacterium]
MAEHRRGGDDRVRLLQRLGRHVHRLPIEEEGAGLKEADSGPRRPLLVERHGELDLHRSLVRPLGEGEHRANRLVHGRILEVEERREREDARPVGSDARREPVGLRVVRGGEAREDAVLLRLRESGFHQVLGLRHGVVRRRRAHVHGPEPGLRRAQEIARRRDRRIRPRVGRRVAPRDAAVHDRLPQAERQDRHALLRARRARGVDVPRARHAREIGIEARAVAPADDLLHDDGHLLLHRPAGRRPVAPRAFEERGGPDELDRLGQAPKAALGVVLVVGDHLRGVDARERTPQRVFQEAGGADRERLADALDEAAQVADDRGRDGGALERAGQRLVAGLRADDLPEPVLVEESIEDVGGEDREARDSDVERRMLLPAPSLFQRALHARQAGRLASQRPVADPGEVFARLEEPPVELRERRTRQIQPRSLQACATRLIAIT